MPKRFAIIVAGGQGLRVGSDLPKQFLQIGGMPILMHTILKFAQSDRIILVLPIDYHDYWEELCKKYQYNMPHKVVSGGDTRYHSVLSGLRALEEAGAQLGDTVLIHDGVRPFVSNDVIEACYRMAERNGAALVYRSLTESLRARSIIAGENDITTSVPRANFISAQTPQAFEFKKLLNAYSSGYKEHYTDDASVWEEAGYDAPKLVMGNDMNIKITTPIDLKIAELFLSYSE